MPPPTSKGMGQGAKVAHLSQQWLPWEALMEATVVTTMGTHLLEVGKVAIMVDQMDLLVLASHHQEEVLEGNP